MTAAKKPAQKTSSETAAPRIQIPTQVLDLQKRILKGQQTFFETSYNAVTAVQENRENMWASALDRASFVPAQLREIADVWAQNRRQARESYKETVDRSFALAEEWIDGLVESRA